MLTSSSPCCINPWDNQDSAMRSAILEMSQNVCDTLFSLSIVRAHCEHGSWRESPLHTQHTLASGLSSPVSDCLPKLRAMCLSAPGRSGKLSIPWRVVAPGGHQVVSWKSELCVPRCPWMVWHTQHAFACACSCSRSNRLLEIRAVFA